MSGALCTMHYALCTMHYALCTMLLIKSKGDFMRIFLSLFLLLSTFCFAEKIRVLAAANVAKALNQIKASYLETHPNDRIEITYVVSGKAYAQIKAGAPVDLFVSADTNYPQRLYEDNLGTQPVVYARGLLVLFSKSQELNSIDDILQAKNIAVPNPELAPYGSAAVAAINKLGYTQQVMDKLRFAESVSQAIQWVNKKTADMGFGALSMMDENTHYIDVDPSLYQPIDQALTITKRGQKSNLAKDFADFIVQSKKTLKLYGYTIPE